MMFSSQASALMMDRVPRVLRSRWKEALDLRDRMEGARFKPDRYTFSGLIEACSKGGNVSSDFES